LVFLALPKSTYEEEEEEPAAWMGQYNAMESYFFNEMVDLSKKRVQRTSLPRKFTGTPPEEISQAMNGFLESIDNEVKSGCQVKLSNPKSSSSRTMETFWFQPVVLNHIRKAIRTRQQEPESSPLEGYSACFKNGNEDYPVQILVDSVLTSEEPGTDDANAGDDQKPFQGSHLTPLAEQLAESLKAAQSVIKEMNYMERRESRMRITADSINSRVRYFSYISVAILLVVTYVQVTYLKRYFRKKKLL
jgi:p24 family protein delta-1